MNHALANRSIPTIMELMESSGYKSGDIIRRLDTMFQGSIAPIVLLSEESFRDIDGFGPKTTAAVKTQLKKFGLSFRDFGKPIEKQAIQVFGSIGAVPIQGLFVYREMSDGVHFAHYLPGRIIHVLSLFRYDMTLSMLINMNRENIKEIIMGNPLGAPTSVHAREMLEELELRLGSWRLELTALSPMEMARARIK